MNKIIFSLSFMLCSICGYAQQEPENNIGKSLSQMQREFPELRYLKTDSKGAQYEDGYPQDGIAVFFYFNKNIVIEECMICQSKDGFPRMWFDKMNNAFVKNYPARFSVNRYNVKHWCYSTFSVHLIYVSEQGTNTALIVYEKGGYNTGITRAEFSKKYESH